VVQISCADTEHPPLLACHSQSLGPPSSSHCPLLSLLARSDSTSSSTMMQQQQQRGGPSTPATTSTFRNMALPMAEELVNDLDREHQKEIDYLYQEQLACRTELARVVELMQKEVVPREKMMHEIIEGMTHSIEEATSHMHGLMGEYVKNHKEKTAGAFLQKESMVDPMQQMEAELNRISQLLAHGPIAPDIQGWAPEQQQGGRGNQNKQMDMTYRPGGSPQRAGTGSPGGYGGAPNFGSTGANYGGGGGGAGNRGQWGNLV